MRALVFVLVAAALAVSGCGSAAPTAAPAPTATVIVPSSTASPIPPTPTAAATPLPPGWPVATLKIVSSLPLTGDSAESGKAINNAMQLRLEQTKSQACGGKYTLRFEGLDDASAALGRWDPGVEKQNARAAAADESIIAYLGTFNSGAAKISIPILNGAGPLVMISPANTYPGLTKPGRGTSGEPGSFYPSGVRNYARVVPSDDLQGQVAANLMFAQLGVKSVYILDDNELNTKNIADAFAAAAKSLGMKVAGRKSINPKAADYLELMKAISTSNGGAAPDAIFASMLIDNNAAQVLSDKVDVMGSNTVVKFMGPDGIMSQALIDNAGGNVSEGVFALVNRLALPDGLSAAGRQFLADYEASYGSLSEPYAIHGYEAMNVLLKAIEDICAAEGDPTDRKQVRDAVFATKDFNGVLGTWSFDKNGDTTLTDMTIYQVKSGSFQVVGTFR